jgi:hypothetical protein
VSSAPDTQSTPAKPPGSTATTATTTTTTSVQAWGILTNSPYHILLGQGPNGSRRLVKGVEKKLVIAQCTDRKKVLFAVHQLYGTAANWWGTYCSTHANIDTITWNEFKAHFHTHYVPRGTMKLKKKEFTDLKQGSMTVNEYFNSFI